MKLPCPTPAGSGKNPLPPVIDGVTTNDATPTITGTATLDTGDVLTVTINGVTYAAGDPGFVVTGSAWRLDVTPALPDGAYTATVTVTGTSGLSSSDTATVVIDTVAPDAPTVDDLSTNDTTPTITGTATLDTGSALSIRVDGTLYSNVPASNGAWELEILEALTAGSYTVDATITDAAGNQATSSGALTVTTGSSAPTVDALSTSDTTPTLTGTVTPGDTLSVSVDGVIYTSPDVVVSGSTWSLTIALTPGAHTVAATSESGTGVGTVTVLEANGLLPAAYTTDVYEQPGTAMPGYLESYTDPTFGGLVTRISGDPGTTQTSDGGAEFVWPHVSRHVYSTTAAWNANESLIMIKAHGAEKPDGSGAPEMLILDGSTYEYIESVYPISPSGRAVTEMRWHATDPNRLIATGGSEVFDWDLTTHTATLVIALPAVEAAGKVLYIGAYQGNSSHDGDRLVVVDSDARGGDGITAWFINMSAGSVISSKTFTPVDDLDTVSVTASGDYIWYNGAKDVTAGPDRTEIFNMNFFSLRYIDQLGNPSHYDSGYDTDGNEVLCGVRKTSAEIAGSAGAVMTHQLDNGTVSLHTDAGYPQHTSMRNVDELGYALCTYPPEGYSPYPPFYDEIVKVKLDGSLSTERWCKTHSSSGIYDAQSQACISPSGTRAVFASDWVPANTGSEPIYCFVVDIRDES